MRDRLLARYEAFADTRASLERSLNALDRGFESLVKFGEVGPLPDDLRKRVEGWLVETIADRFQEIKFLLTELEGAIPEASEE